MTVAWTTMKNSKLSSASLWHFYGTFGVLSETERTNRLKLLDTVLSNTWFRCLELQISISRF